MGTTEKRNTEKSVTVKRGSVHYCSARKGTFIAVRFRKPGRKWDTNLESNLVEEGFTRAKVRHLVKLAAS